MLRNSADTTGEAAGKTAEELRRFAGLSASLLRAAASRIGMTATDLQVVDILDGAGPATPGELAELTGLTTGAIAGMLNRLEESGLLRRERDPVDGRRVIVRLDSASERMRAIESVFQSLALAWDEALSAFDEEQARLIADFLRRCNAQSRAAIEHLRGPMPEGDEVSSAPIGEVLSGRLVVSGAPKLKISVDENMADLYQARFEGARPEVKAHAGDVSIRYARTLSSLFGAQRSAVVTLGATIPWEITVHGGSAMITAELANLNLTGFEAEGGGSVVSLELPVPSAAVLVRISGGGSVIKIRRPTGVAVRARLKGSGSQLSFDEQPSSASGNGAWLQSTDYSGLGSYYSIEIASSGSSITISTL